MNLTESIAEEICERLYGKPLHELENNWSGENQRTLTYKKELQELFRLASGVRYLRNGITPKWIGDERFLSRCQDFVQEQDAVAR